MLNRKVIVSDINNLTDARYFAAWMVDYLFFSPHSISTEQMAEITNWLEGPKYGIWVQDGFDNDSLFQIINTAGISALLLSENNDTIRMDFPALEIFYLSENKLIDLNEGEDFLLVENYHDLESLDNKNLWIRAGGEEKVGYKDFDEYDQIFEAIEL